MRRFWHLLQIGTRLYGFFKVGVPLLAGVGTWIALHVFTALPTYLVVAAAVAAALVMLGVLGGALRLIRRALNHSLAADFDYYARELQRFLTDQEAFSYWRDESGDQVIGRSQRLMSRYRERFESDIVPLVEAVVERGVRDEQLERIYEHPTNPLGIQELARRLAAVSRRLRQL